MPDLALTVGLLGRPRLNLPTLRATNCYLEPSAEGPEKDVRTSRPGLTVAFEVGTGPILRSFQKPGLFNNDVFNVSGGELYRETTLLGTVAYSQNPRFAAAQNFLALVCGGGLYVYDGATFAPVLTFDDGVSPLPAFSGCAVLDNIWIYPVAGSNQWFFSSVGDPTTINAANFSSAQVSPTPIVEVATLAEELYFFKTDVVEIWDFQGSLTAPFAESPGRTYARGCASQGSVTLTDNALFWIGDDLAVYRTGTVPQRLTESTSYVEDRLHADTNLDLLTSFTFNIEAHAFYGVNLVALGETYVFDCQTKQWFCWGTQSGQQLEPALFLGNTATGQGRTIWLGSAVDGKVYLADVTSHTDGGVAMRCVVAGARYIGENVERMNNLTILMVRGVATTAVPDPLGWLRWSSDGGRTWTTWTPGDIGGIGHYRFKISWHSLGLTRQPGRIFEFAISSAVNFTIEGAQFNVGRR